jgi:Glycosyltransferase family 9 (heptosyltransferase)
VAPGRGRPRLLILRALGLGDLLTAAPALRALARAYPDYERVLGAPALLAPLVRCIDPELRVEPVGELEALPASVHGASMAVNLHGRGPQSHRLLRETRPEDFIWFEHPEIGESIGAPRWLETEHEVRRWCRLLSQSGVPADPGELDIEPPPGEPPEAAREATLVHPGAASGARRWPAERFAEVALHERRQGRRVVVTGGPGEVELAERIVTRAGLGPESMLAGRTDLADLARAVGAAGRVLCGDTGVAHLATALGTPSVVLFGPTSPELWGPPVERASHRVLWAGASGDPHGAQPFAGLLELGCEEVIDALETLPGLFTAHGTRIAAGAVGSTLAIEASKREQ